MGNNYTHIKNIAIAGHHGSGKTSLTEAILKTAGVTERMGTIENGQTVSDYTNEEIRKKSSVYMTLTNFEKSGYKYNILDTPGSLDFIGEEIEGIWGADSVVITVSGKSGVKVGTEKAYKICKDLNKPHMFVVTKIDDENANFNNVLTQLKATFGPAVCPVIVPIISNEGKVAAIVNLIEMKAYKYENGKVTEIPMPTSAVSEKLEYRIDGLVEAMSEAVAEVDENLFEKFFSGEKFTQDELIDGIHKGVKLGIITPVACVSAIKSAGIDMLLKEFELLLPTSSENDTIIAEDKNGNIAEVKCSSDESTVAYVFKQSIDAYIGKMSFIKVISGSIKTGDELFVSGRTEKSKIGKIVTLNGKTQSDLNIINCGDIGVVLKTDFKTGNTLTANENIVLEVPEFPKPVYNRTAKPSKQGDESKMISAISKILEEDPTVNFYMDEDTKEQIISGLGEQHLLSKKNKLLEVFGTDIEFVKPKIAYKETICKKSKVEAKYKKQSGGHGQYGDVVMEFEPWGNEENKFEEKIVGGAVPKNFFPAIEKGVNETLEKGVLGGYPVVGVRSILVDGSYHPVDSSEMSFKTAGAMAAKNGLKQADPVILEPIGKLTALVPDENTGDLIGELNKRRGRILGMDSDNKTYLTKIEAEVPMREMADFEQVIRSMTQGAGSYSLAKERYDKLPQNLLADVLIENK